MSEMMNCVFEELNVDEACVSVTSREDVDLWLYALASDCVTCPYSRFTIIPRKKTIDVKVSSNKAVSWRVYNNNGVDQEYIPITNKSNIFCEFHSNFGELVSYHLNVKKNECDVKTVLKPSSHYLPLYFAVGAILCILGMSWCIKSMFKLIGKSHRERKNEVEVKPTKRRVLSIDTIRGISILFMIFVNDGAGGYSILSHATWNGLLMGDLIFPCFMWIMGFCIPLSLSSQLSRGTSRSSICLSIIKRSVLLFFIGLALNTLGTDARLANIRIFGILQRFGITYMVIALMYTLKIYRKLGVVSVKALKCIQDIIALWSQWFLVIVIVGIHYALIFHFPVPGCPKGYLGPGGIHSNAQYFNCTGGATGYIDRKILGINHLYQHLEIVFTYHAKPFDPEGIVGCLTSVLQVFLGVQAGQILLCFKDWKNRVARWLLWALLLGFLGLYLHLSDVIPVNKNLWSLSFVFVTTCFCLTLFSACYLLVDVLEIWKGGPFRIPGMNALALYVGHQMCFQIFPFHWKIFRMNTHGWLLAENLWGVGLWTFLAYVLHYKRIYINI